MLRVVEVLQEDYFNSIKVRLRPGDFLQNLQQYAFQFHKGSIKTGNGSRTWGTGIFNFNSIKVRLRPATGSDDTVPVGFQFHKGSIKTMER